MWLIPLLILLIVIGLYGQQPKETFMGTISNICQIEKNANSDEWIPLDINKGASDAVDEIPSVTNLYKNWGNGGINESNYPSESLEPNGGLLRTYTIPKYYPEASVQDPSNTLVDQLICKDYAKRTCLDVSGLDRFNYCRSAQYETCMNGRKRTVWQASATDPERAFQPAVDN